MPSPTHSLLKGYHTMPFEKSAPSLVTGIYFSMKAGRNLHPKTILGFQLRNVLPQYMIPHSSLHWPMKPAYPSKSSWKFWIAKNQDLDVFKREQRVHIHLEQSLLTSLSLQMRWNWWKMGTKPARPSNFFSYWPRIYYRLPCANLIHDLLVLFLQTLQSCHILNILYAYTSE